LGVSGPAERMGGLWTPQSAFAMVGLWKRSSMWFCRSLPSLRQAGCAGGWVSWATTASQALNGFVYFAALPALFFGAMATVPLAETFNHLPFILDYMGTIVVLGLITWVIGRRLFPGKGDALGLQNMAALFANTGYMGIPLLITAFGSVGKLPAIIATVLNGAIVMAFYIALVEYHQSDAEHRAKVFGDAALGVVKSPLVISAALGILWSGIGVPVPVFLAKFCEILGAAAPPSALFAMGLFLVGKSFRGDMKEIGLLTTLKLVVHPLLAWACCCWCRSTMPGRARCWCSPLCRRDRWSSCSPAAMASIPSARPASSSPPRWSRWRRCL